MNIGDTKSILKLLEHGLSNVIFKQNVIFQLQDAENPICYITNTICLKSNSREVHSRLEKSLAATRLE